MNLTIGFVATCTRFQSFNSARPVWFYMLIGRPLLKCDVPAARTPDFPACARSLSTEQPSESLDYCSEHKVRSSVDDSQRSPKEMRGWTRHGGPDWENPGCDEQTACLQHFSSRSGNVSASMTVAYWAWCSGRPRPVPRATFSQSWLSVLGLCDSVLVCNRKMMDLLTLWQKRTVSNTSTNERISRVVSVARSQRAIAID